MEHLPRPAAGKADAYVCLRRSIVYFKLLPGQLLSEHSLGAQLGLGRTPVREALARLAAEGCVEVFPQRGTQVSRIQEERVRQAVFLREVLERDVLRRLCAAPLGPEQFAMLEQSMARQRELAAAQQAAGLLEEDTRMHRLLYRFCGREGAWDAYAALDCDMDRVRYLQMRTYNYRRTPAFPVDSWESRAVEHRMMLDALRKRDAEALELLCASHLEHIERSAGELRRIYPQYFQPQEAAS